MALDPRIQMDIAMFHAGQRATNERVRLRDLLRRVSQTLPLGHPLREEIAREMQLWNTPHEE